MAASRNAGTRRLHAWHPREVFWPAIVSSAAGIVLGHNHPSGDPEPSPKDIAWVAQLADLHDHGAFTRERCISLKKRHVY